MLKAQEIIGCKKHWTNRRGSAYDVNDDDDEATCIMKLGLHSSSCNVENDFDDDKHGWASAEAIQLTSVGFVLKYNVKMNQSYLSIHKSFERLVKNK